MCKQIRKTLLTLDRANKITPVEYNTYFNTIRTVIQVTESALKSFSRYELDKTVKFISKLYSLLQPDGFLNTVQLRIKEVEGEASRVPEYFQKVLDQTFSVVNQNGLETAFEESRNLRDFAINVSNFVEAFETFISQLPLDDLTLDVEEIEKLRTLSDKILNSDNCSTKELSGTISSIRCVLNYLESALSEELLFVFIDSYETTSVEPNHIENAKVFRAETPKLMKLLKDYIYTAEKFSDFLDEPDLVSKEIYSKYSQYWSDLVLAYNKLISELPIHLEKLQSLELISNETVLDYRMKAHRIQDYCYRFTNSVNSKKESKARLRLNTVVNSIVSKIENNGLVSSFISLVNLRVKEKGLSENLEVLTINQYIELLEDLQTKTRDLLEGKVQDCPLILEVEDSKRVKVESPKTEDSKRDETPTLISQEDLKEHRSLLKIVLQEVSAVTQTLLLHFRSLESHKIITSTEYEEYHTSLSEVKDQSNRVLKSFEDFEDGETLELLNKISKNFLVLDGNPGFLLKLQSLLKKLLSRAKNGKLRYSVYWKSVLPDDIVNIDRIKVTLETLTPTTNLVHALTTPETLGDDNSYPFNLLTLECVKDNIERWSKLNQKVSEINLEVKEICEELTASNLISFEERCNHTTVFLLLDECNNLASAKIQDGIIEESLEPLKQVCKTLLPIKSNDDSLGDYFFSTEELFKSVLYKVADLELNSRIKEVVLQITELEKEVKDLLGIGFKRVEESKRKAPFELGVVEYHYSKNNWLDFLYAVTEYLGVLSDFFKELGTFKEFWTQEAQDYARKTIEFVVDFDGICDDLSLKSTTEILDLITLISTNLKEMQEDDSFIGFFDKLRLKLHRKVQEGDANENAFRKLCVDSISLSINLVHLNNQITRTLGEPSRKLPIPVLRKKSVPSEFKVRTTLENFQRYRLEWITLVQDSRLVFSEMDTTVKFLQKLGIYSEEEASLAYARDKEFIDLCSKFLNQTTCDSYDNTLLTLNSIILALVSVDEGKSILLKFNDRLIERDSLDKLLGDEMQFVFEYSNLTRNTAFTARQLLSGDNKKTNGLVPFQKYKQDDE